ncbi:MAG: AMP-binding protein [Chloroflexi bacterium]|nr:AMP-binding protein [Chloroflexota bacterium]
MLEAVLDALSRQGISSKPLAVSHAFHSPLMDSILDEFESAAQRIACSAPRILLISNLTGGILGAEQTPDARYWREHIRAEVKFSAGMSSLAALGIDAFIEIGPSPVLLGMGKRCLPESQFAWLPSLRQNQDDWQTLLDSLGKLYLQGAGIDWAGFDEGYSRRKVSLPNYPFDRRRYWLEPSNKNTDSTVKIAPVPSKDVPQRKNGNNNNHKSQSVRTPVMGLDRSALLNAEPNQRQRLLEDYLQKQTARILGMEPSRLSLVQPLDTLGLDSLMAMELKNSLERTFGVNLSVASLLQGPTISGLAVEALNGLDSPEVPNEARLVISNHESDESPLSYGQQALWFLHELLPEDISFNVAGAIRIRGALDVTALERAFAQLTGRHESLRSTFHVVAGEPIQRVHDLMMGVFKLEDVSDWDEADLRGRLTAEAHRPFDLEHGPVWRAVLFRTKSEHVLLLAMDHIITDFWSMTVLASETLVLYEANKSGGTISLPPLQARYSDFVRWQSGMLASAAGERLWEYWRGELAGELPALNLPTDRPRSALQTYRGDSRHLFMDAELCAKVKSLAQEQGATMFMTLLAAFQTLLYRYANQEKFLVGSVTAGRSHAELAGLVGYFINPIPLKADFSGNPTFNEFLARVRRTTLGAFEHQDYPPALLAKRLGIQRDSSRPPLFETMFILQKAQEAGVQALSPFALGLDGARMEAAGLTLESIALGGEPAQFDLTMMMSETEGGLAAALQFNTDLFDAATIEQMLGHFHSLLREIVSDPHKPVSAYSLLNEAERRRLLVEWNQTQAEYPRDLCVHELIREQARRTPDSIALQFGEQTLTYKELDKRSTRVAKVLSSRGVKPGTLVGLFVHRSLDMVVGQLGALKAGGAYLPLDPSFPAERLAFMLADSGASILLTQSNLRGKLPEPTPKSFALTMSKG